MNFSSKNFLGCAFPEEYMFWVLVVSAISTIASFTLLHGEVIEKIKKTGFYPVAFLIFNSANFTKKGQSFRRLFLVGLAINVAIIMAFYIGYEFDILSCGRIDY